MSQRRVVPLIPIALSLTRLATGPAFEAAATGPADPGGAAPAIAAGDYEVEGVEVDLLSVKRVSDGTLTVTWEYRNKTDPPKKLGASFEDVAIGQ